MDSKRKDTDDVPKHHVRGVGVDVENDQSKAGIFIEVRDAIAEKHNVKFLEAIVVPQIMYDFFEEMDDLVELPVCNDDSVLLDKFCKSKLRSIVSCLNKFVAIMNTGMLGVSPATVTWKNRKFVAHHKGQMQFFSTACQFYCFLMNEVIPYIFVEDGVKRDNRTCLYEVQCVYKKVRFQIKREMLGFVLGDLYDEVKPEAQKRKSPDEHSTPGTEPKKTKI